MKLKESFDEEQLYSVLQNYLIDEFIIDDNHNKYQIANIGIKYFEDDYCNLCIWAVSKKGKLMDYDLVQELYWNDNAITRSLNAIGKPYFKFGFSESGMQGDDYLNFDVKIKILKSSK